LRVLRRAVYSVAMKTSLLFLFLALSVHAADLPLGHKDFAPSPQQPVGWRGDGNALFPAATPVTDWNLATGSNVIWRARLPWFSCAGPIVVGDRVFTTAEPDRLICVDAKTGQVLWERRNAPVMEALPAEKRQELYALTDKLLELHEDIQLWTAYMEEGRQDPVAATKLATEKPRSVDTIRAVIQLHGGDGGGYLKQNEASAHRYLAERKEFVERLLGTSDLREIRALHARVSREAHSTATRQGLSLEEREKTVPKLAVPKNEVDLIVKSWWHFFGNTFPTPASDGRYVVVKQGLGNAWNRLVCYDLDGNRIWAQELGAESTWGGALSSPVISEGLVICHDLRSNVENTKGITKEPAVLAAFDIQTGRRVWVSSADFAGNSSTPLIVRIDGVPLVVKGGKVFRVKDGRCVLEKVEGTSPEGNQYALSNNWDTPVWDGRDIVWGTATTSHVGSRSNQPRAGWRLRWRDADKLVLESEFVQGEKDISQLGWVRGSIVHHDGLLYRAGRGKAGRVRLLGVALADSRAFQCEVSRPNWRNVNQRLARSWPNEDNMCATFGGGLFFGCTSDVPSQFLIATKGPNPREISSPEMDDAVTGHVWFQGDRVYIRGYRYLYCFGDPAKSDPAPRGRP
jgi:outer membrane protein assembly factor BamB